MKRMNSKKGFTLIELLIVIAIIAVLAVALLPTLMGAPSKARDTQRLTQVQKISGWLLTKSLSGTAMPGLAAGTGSVSCIDPTSGAAGGSIGELIYTNLSDFGGNAPKEPKTDNTTGTTAPVCTGQYGYVRYNTGKKYSAGVFANMENTSNGNIACTAAAIKNDTDPALVPGSGSCFLVTVQ